MHGQNHIKLKFVFASPENGTMCSGT